MEQLVRKKENKMDELILEAQEKMNKSCEALVSSLSTLRTGRASPNMLSNVLVDYYGSPTPINQISSISIPEPRQLLIKPYDRNDVKSIVSAITASDLGLNPINEGNVIRLIIPALTEDRRREIVKQGKKYGEDTKVAIRNVRREFMDFIKEDKEISEDYQKRLETDLQKVTDESIKKVDSLVSEKEKEIMAI